MKYNNPIEKDLDELKKLSETKNLKHRQILYWRKAHKLIRRLYNRVILLADYPSTNQDVGFLIRFLYTPAHNTFLNITLSYIAQGMLSNLYIKDEDIDKMQYTPSCLQRGGSTKECDWSEETKEYDKKTLKKLDLKSNEICNN